MNNRIETRLAELKAQNRKALVTYITAGCGGYEQTEDCFDNNSIGHINTLRPTNTTQTHDSSIGCTPDGTIALTTQRNGIRQLHRKRQENACGKY